MLLISNFCSIILPIEGLDKLHTRLVCLQYFTAVPQRKCPFKLHRNCFVLQNTALRYRNKFKYILTWKCDELRQKVIDISATHRIATQLRRSMNGPYGLWNMSIA